MKYQRLGLPSCSHAPYNHKDLLKFYTAVQKHYDLTDVIHLGDEWDFHSYSYHEKDPELKGSQDEVSAAQVFSRKLETIWPKLTILHSNHASLIYRKARTSGIPHWMIRSYREIHGVESGWVWEFEKTITLPDGSPLHLNHGTKANAWSRAQKQGTNTASGHWHTLFYVQTFRTFTSQRWAMQVGTGIDASSRAFAYGKENLGQPILGMGVVIDSKPQLVPMTLTKSGKWDGKL